MLEEYREAWDVLGVSRGGGVAEDEVSPAGELAVRHPYPSRFNV
jgi:hypothetical protein